ncbi:TolC family protein [Lentisphaera marina]|uniref:TolC family protein n=1 Tax=Lentisphaera marina TaxID=1111041 RepID=UPI002366B719|nr:TolC family protein [Lentisphaera marina]MDD7984141.1 TolC family protein [Lentisphaera marina]
MKLTHIFLTCTSIGLTINATSPHVGSNTQSTSEIVTDYSKSLSLSELTNLAFKNSLVLKSSYLNWQSELLRVYAKGTLPDPQISFTHYIDEVETRVGPQKQAISIMQKFPWFGKIELNKAMQSERAKVAEAEFKHEKLNVLSQVEKLYFDTVYVKEALRINEENQTLLKSFEPISRNKIRTGGNLTDLLKIQMEIGKTENRVAELKLRLKPLKERLNEILDYPSGFPLKLSHAKPKTMALDSKKLYAKLKSSPSIQKINHLSEALRQQSNIDHKNSYPDFSIGIKYIRTSSSDMNVDDNGKDPIMATIGLTIPINQKKYRHRRLATLRQIDSVEYQKAQKLRSLESDLAIALYELEDKERALKLYKYTLIPKNEESLKLTMESYKTGKSRFIEIIDLQRQLLEFQLMELKAENEIYKQYSEIQALTSSVLMEEKKNE